MRLERAFWPDVEKYLKTDDRLVVPAGSVEQHGPAVAAGIDYIIAEAVSRKAADEAGVYCAPALCYGMSLHHGGFPGTASLKPSSYLAMLVDLLTFFVDGGFRRIVIVNGHGGNVGILKSAAAEVAYERRGARIAPRDWYGVGEVAALIEETFGDREGSHVTPAEVSVLMHIDPELVGDVSRVERTKPGLIAWAAGRDDLREYYPAGAVGSDPSLASAETGKRLFAASVRGVKEVLEGL
jgi:creatinine amidohydrolase